MGEERREARSYQTEIVIEAKKENTIVCLGTGTGKTFISAMVIKELQGGIKGEYRTGGKRTFFLVCTVPLAVQQAEEIRMVSALKVASYTGDMDVDLWDEDRWVKEFDENDVLVMTHQILLDLLRDGFLGFHNINLLVFDECHNANKKHPYVRILEFHQNCPDYPLHGMQCTCPRVLGLTASVINTKLDGKKSVKNTLEEKMKDLEAKMRARCITCQDPNATFKFAAKPVEIVKTFQKGIASARQRIEYEQEIMIINDGLHEKLYGEYKRFKAEFEYNQEHGADSIALGLEQSEQSQVVYGKIALDNSDVFLMASDAMNHVRKIMEKLGTLSTYEIARTLANKLNGYKKRTLTDISRNTFQEVLGNLKEVLETYENFFQRVNPGQEVSDATIKEPFITNRAHTLLTDILQKQHVQFTAAGDALHGIIFVKRRCMAVLLSKLLNDKAKQCPAMFGWLKSDYVLGHAVDESLSLADRCMKSNNQNEVLGRFKKGEFNILVSTSVVEEGLDVRKCNIVIRFSGIGTFRQYAQSKGRARSMNSKFIIMCSEKKKSKTTRELRQMQEVETVLLGMCRETRKVPSWKDTEEAMFDEEKKYIPTYYLSDRPDSARITSGNCVAILHRYCNRLLSSSSFTRHNYVYERTKDLSETRATVYLPQDIPLEDKVVTGYWMPTIKLKNKGRKKKKKKAYQYLAKKSVCEIVGIMLHTAGCIDEHIIEILTKDPYDDPDDDSDDDSDDESDGVEEITEALSELNIPRDDPEDGNYPRRIPPCLLQREPKGFRLFMISMLLVDPKNCDQELIDLWYSERKGFGILLPLPGPNEFPEIDVYTNAGGVSVQLKPLQHTISDIPMSFKRFHQRVTDLYAPEYIDGEMKFDFDNPTVAKGILVPLRQEVCSAVDCNQDLSKLGNSVESLIDQNALDISQESSIMGEYSVIRKTYLSEDQNRRLYYVTSLSNIRAGDIMDKHQTYAQYYRTKYDRHVADSTQLLKVLPISTKVSLTETPDNENKKVTRREDLVPELCEKIPCVDAALHMQMVILPYFFYKSDCILNARELLNNIAQDIEISKEETMTHLPVDSKTNSLPSYLRSSLQVSPRTKSPRVMQLLECLTAKQAKFGFDLERMEMLGDSFLKQAVTIYLYFRWPEAQEEKLTDRRKENIVNSTLFKIAGKRGIQNIICNSQFGNTNRNTNNKNPLTVWLPPGYSRDTTENDPKYKGGPYQEIREKTLADSVEALIGLYFMTGGVNLALTFMQKYLRTNVFFSVIPEKYQNLLVSKKQSCYADYPVANSAATGEFQEGRNAMDVYEALRLSRLESEIGYEFKDKSYLIQALTHKSYRSLNESVTSCYERMEFLGDAILDFLVTLHIFTNNSSLGPGDLTVIRSALVNNNTLALLVIEHGIDKFVRHADPTIEHLIKNFRSNTRHNEGAEAFRECYASPFIVIPKGSDEGYQAPKILGDVFEAVVCAIFFDCDLDLGKVWTFFIYPLMKDIIVEYMKNVPKNPVTVFTEACAPSLEWSLECEQLDGDTYECVASFGDRTAVGRGENKKIATATAAWIAVQMMKNDRI